MRNNGIGEKLQKQRFERSLTPLCGSLMHFAWPIIKESRSKGEAIKVPAHSYSFSCRSHLNILSHIFVSDKFMR